MRWLIDLFATPEEAEAILGDLQEERSQIARSQGQTRARTWYVRQAIRTVAHLACGPFSQSPFTMIGLGILGLALTFPVNWALRQLAYQLVVRVPVYQYVPATTFWMALSLAAPFATGFAGAWILRRHAMSTALSAFLALLLLVFVIDPLVLSFIMPRRMVPPGFILARALALLSSWGLTMLAGTALGIKLRREMPIA